MSVMTSVRSAVTDFRNGLSFIFGKPEPGEGDRKLAKIAIAISSQINSFTKPSIRKNVLNDIERVLGNEAKKGGKKAVEAKIALSLATPEWMRMIHRLNLNEYQVRYIGVKVVREYEKRVRR